MTNPASSILPDRSSRRPRSRNIRRALVLSVVGTAAALAALGSASPAFGASTGGSGTSTPAGGGGRFPGASGTIAAITGTSLEVQNAQTGQTTVTFTPTTTFQQTVKANASAVTVGSCITATGKPTKKASKKSSKKSAAQTFGEPVTATAVSITQPTSGSCTTGFGGGFGGAGGAAGGRFPRTGGSGGAPGGEAPGGQRPTGGFRGRLAGQFAAASGSVTAVTGSKVTVNEVNPRTKKSSSVVVTLSSVTAFSERQSAAAADLAVGKCASSFGSADSTGAVTATSITISTPGASGCTTGFGGFGGGRAPGGPAGA
jgi:hypothetical protein